MHILLYVLDALRHDHLSCYGYHRETSPAIDRLSDDAVIFQNSFTVSTWTRPAAASILSGLYPGAHGVLTRNDIFSEEILRIPEVLAENGFRTAGFNTMGNIAGKYGFSHGFDKYIDLCTDPDIVSKRQNLNPSKEGLIDLSKEGVGLPRAEDINRKLIPWIAENRKLNTFSFVWSIETHAPFDPPVLYRKFSEPSYHKKGAGQRSDLRTAVLSDRQRLMNLYDDEILYNDHCVDQIVASLKELDVYEESMIILAGDHGESFFEHGIFGHGHTPYDELIHVPLIIKLPFNSHAGLRVDELVELIDIFPTILGASDINKDINIQGHNLYDVIAGNFSSSRDYVFSETQSLQIHNHYLSVRSKTEKYIRRIPPARDAKTFLSTIQHMLHRRIVFDVIKAPRHFIRSYFSPAIPREMYFNLIEDPYEKKNLASTHKEEVEHFVSVLNDWIQENENTSYQRGREKLTSDEDEILRRHLEELGYW